MGECGTQRAEHGVPAGTSLTTRPEGPGGPGSPTAPVGPGRPWEKKQFRAVPTSHRAVPCDSHPRAESLTRPGGPVSPGSPCQKPRDRMTSQKDKRLLSPSPLAKPTGMRHLDTQPHCRVTTSQGGGRCYPGVDMAQMSLLFLLGTHSHTPILTFRPEGPWGPAGPARP